MNKIVILWTKNAYEWAFHKAVFTEHYAYYYEPNLDAYNPIVCREGEAVCIPRWLVRKLSKSNEEFAKKVLMKYDGLSEEKIAKFDIYEYEIGYWRIFKVLSLRGKEAIKRELLSAPLKADRLKSE